MFKITLKIKLIDVNEFFFRSSESDLSFSSMPYGLQCADGGSKLDKFFNCCWRYRNWPIRRLIHQESLRTFEISFCTWNFQKNSQKIKKLLTNNFMFKFYFNFMVNGNCRPCLLSLKVHRKLKKEHDKVLDSNFI